MAMRSVLRNLSGARSSAAAIAQAAAAHDKGGNPSSLSGDERLQMLDAIEEEGIAWFWATNAENHLTYLSASAARHLGEDVRIFGQPLGQIMETVGEDEENGPERSLNFLLTAHQKFADITVRLETGQGPVWWSLTGRPHFGENREFLGYRGSAKDISELFQQRRDASRLAQFDALTGLANRHRMSRRLATILASCRASKRSCAMLMLDLDRFKQVNDTLGHPAGDDLLKQVAQRLRRVITENAEIGRLGGDEFQIILPDIDDRGRLGELAHRIIQMISQPYSIEDSRAIIGTSVGIAIAPYDGLEPDDLTKAADLALYASKDGGRGRYRFYSNDLKDSAQERREIEEDLRGALARGELELHYQPVVRAADHMLSGFEAQIRWNHPERGYVSPAQFLPVAEDSGLASPIGAWAIRQACEDAAHWPGSLRVSINVSEQQFNSEELASIVAKSLGATGLMPERLELEIAESVFMGDVELVDRIFSQLKKLGVRLALDEFGTGNSSLSYLRKTPFDCIKIHPSFVRECTETGSPNAAIIAAIVSLANALGMETTAEGVEAMDELELVCDRGATNIQGFVYSRAMPQADVLDKVGSGDLRFEPSGPPMHRAERRTVYRRIGVIHENHRYEAVLRNLSRTGARIDGLLDVPVGTELVLDLGEGQLVVATVRRSQDATQGLEFETPLISNGSDGLCTRYRISPYALAAAGMPLRSLPPGDYPLIGNGQNGQPAGRPRFMQVDLSAASGRAA
ncbi:diguanylate cyclase (GGDEF)-like protein [Altererythrobacter atlanticus]|uniref:Phytochrome-like protein cph2 n=2 Tax=Croceibacterium atlanticum TaxID=1267766 RepID=A0A0F7KQ88_9SPHN|nr:EAL domain-containing protein [Croceibacterium atlanticum]AKH41307.1 Phytochrome-like protein cph2 [Croceibacterium atlanticum]MBB5732825.1 diguanylate cyclase (GGDEF)-like protein [Croceibacterium atlanticum]